MDISLNTFNFKASYTFKFPVSRKREEQMREQLKTAQGYHQTCLGHHRGFWIDKHSLMWQALNQLDPKYLVKDFKGDTQKLKSSIKSVNGRSILTFRTTNKIKGTT